MNYYIVEDAESLNLCKIVSFTKNFKKAIEMQEIFKTQNPLMTYKILIEMKGGLKHDN